MFLGSLSSCNILDSLAHLRNAVLYFSKRTEHNHNCTASAPSPWGFSSGRFRPCLVATA